MSRESKYFDEGYCARGHRQKPENVIHGRCRICKQTDDRRDRRNNQREERQIAAAARRENKHGPELVRVPVRGWGCRF